MSERITRTSEEPLNNDDLRLLKDKKNKQLLFIVPPYFALLAIVVFKWATGPAGFDDEEAQTFWAVAPYLFGFLFLTATIYFSKLFVQSIYPLMKDIKNNKKSLIFYTPAKSAMPFFNRYFYRHLFTRISR